MANLPNRIKPRIKSIQELQRRSAMSNEHFYIEDGNTTEYEGEFDSIQLRGDGIVIGVLEGKELDNDVPVDLLVQYNLAGVTLNAVIDLEPDIISPVVFTKIQLVSGAVRLNR